VAPFLLLPLRAPINKLLGANGACCFKGSGVTTLTLLDFACTAVTLGLCALTAASCVGSKRSHAGLFLVAYFVCLSVDSAAGLVWDAGYGSLTAEFVRWLHVANVPIAYLLGPLLYGCIVAVVSPAFPAITRRVLWHVIPCGLVFAVSVCNAVFAFDTSRVGNLVFKITYHAWVFQGLLYLAMAIQHVRGARSLLEQANADEAVLRLSWLHGLLALNGVIWGLMLMDRVYEITGLLESPWQSAASDVFGTLALFGLAWFGLHLPRVASSGPAETLPVEQPTVNGAPSYARSGLNAEQCVEMAADLAQLMEKDRLYVDSRFDLQTLSRCSGWPSNYISQAINQGLHQNFFEFVNGFRVAAAERYLADPADRRTILEVAFTCGFGSKSTFNAVFKRMTGHTPSEFRRARLAGSNEVDEATA
jgi:AraC-like DNA-binding protein